MKLNLLKQNYSYGVLPTFTIQTISHSLARWHCTQKIVDIWNECEPILRKNERNIWKLKLSSLFFPFKLFLLDQKISITINIFSVMIEMLY